MASAEILTVPTEVIEYTLTLCPLSTVAAFSQTCRQANAVVYESSDSYLWRGLFLLYPFDDPRKSVHGSDDQHVDWKADLIGRMEARAVVFSPDEFSLEQAFQTLVTVLYEAPARVGVHSGPSANITWLSKVLKDSNILESLSLPPSVPLARLRCCNTLLSTSAASTPAFSSFRYLASQRSNARAQVYDMRKYRPENNWGLYLDGAREVDWVQVEAVVNVIGTNLGDIARRMQRRPLGGLEATRAYSAPATQERDPKDWAGVVGSWRRYVSFIDYNDLYAYNYTITANGSLDPSLFANSSFKEATRLIDIKFSLVEPADMPEKALRFLSRDDAFDGDEDDEQKLGSGLEGTVDTSMYPPIYYLGIAGLQTSEASVEGVVRMGPDGSVRWKFLTMYDSEGDNAWCSEGVQIGQVGSAAGVIGVWTCANHNDGDPIGPFWMWKIF